MSLQKYNPNTGRYEPYYPEGDDVVNDLLKPNSRVDSGQHDPNGLGRSPDSAAHNPSNPRDPDYTNGLAQMVINSPAYQLAYSIFSKLDDKSWLNQLEMIPYSASLPDEFLFDSFTQSDNDKKDAAYQYCIEKVENLYQAYRQYVQDLPLTQRQQLADAGIYDTDTVSGADIQPSATPSANPSSVHLGNPSLDVVSRVADCLFASSNGALSWFTALKNADFAERGLDLDEKSLELQAKGLEQRGLSILLDKERLNLAREQFANSVESDKSEQALKYFDQAISFLQLGYESVPNAPQYIDSAVGDLSSVKSDKASKVPQNLVAMDYSETAHKLAATPSVTQESLAVMQGFNDYTFKLWKLSIQRDAALAERDRALADYQTGLASAGSGNPTEEGKYIAELNKKVSRFNSRIAQHRYAYIEGLYKQGREGNKFARYAYGYMMSGYDFNSQLNMTRRTDFQIEHGWTNTAINALDLVL